MSKEQENKAIVGRWFKEFWGNPWNPEVVDELATPDILLQYSLHAPRRGREDVKKFMTGFREAFPDLNFRGAADLIAEGDYVVGRWEGGGTHTGPAFSDFLRVPSGCFWPEDAVHRNDRASCRKRQDRRGNRPGRWGDRAAATRPLNVRREVIAASISPASATTRCDVNRTGGWHPVWFTSKEKYRINRAYTSGGKPLDDWPPKNGPLCSTTQPSRSKAGHSKKLSNPPSRRRHRTRLVIMIAGVPSGSAR